MSSILDDIKKILGIDSEDTSFDTDILLHINSVFSTLTQLGIGPEDGFAIEDATSEWDDFIETDPKTNFLKTYIYLRVRLLFDPPQTSYLIDSMNKQLREFEWRLNTLREETEWVDPTA